MPRPTKKKASWRKNLWGSKEIPEESSETIDVSDDGAEDANGNESERSVVSIESEDSDDEADLDRASLDDELASKALFRILQEGVNKWTASLQEKPRPVKYKKVSLPSQKPIRTIQDQKAKAKKKETELRKQGYADIRSMFPPRTQPKDKESLHQAMPIGARTKQPKTRLQPKPNPFKQSFTVSSSGSLSNIHNALLTSGATLEDDQQPASMSQPASSIDTLAASASSMHPPIFDFGPSGSFRTGLTPSMGLTPLIGGPVAFPPPSPNTGAFLAMENSGAAGSAFAATITPNALNTLTGALQQHTAASQVQQQSNGNTVRDKPSSGTSQTTQTSGVPSQMAVSASTNYQSSPLASQSRYAQQPNMYQTTQAYASNGNGNGYTGTSGIANHAANGLLLSQAHQRPTKREEATKQQNLAQTNGSAVNGKASVAQAQTMATTSGVNNAKRGAKRKGDSGSITSNTSAMASAPKRSKSLAAISTRSAATRRGGALAGLKVDVLLEVETEDDGANTMRQGNVRLGVEMDDNNAQAVRKVDVLLGVETNGERRNVDNLLADVDVSHTSPSQLYIEADKERRDVATNAEHKVDVLLGAETEGSDAQAGCKIDVLLGVETDDDGVTTERRDDGRLGGVETDGDGYNVRAGLKVGVLLGVETDDDGVTAECRDDVRLGGVETDGDNAPAECKVDVLLGVETDKERQDVDNLLANTVASLSSSMPINSSPLLLPTVGDQSRELADMLLWLEEEESEEEQEDVEGEDDVDIRNRNSQRTTAPRGNGRTEKANRRDDLFNVHRAPDRENAALLDAIYRLNCIWQEVELGEYFRGRLAGMLVFLQLYTGSKTYNWIEASKVAAEVGVGRVGRGPHRARCIRQWVRNYLRDEKNLPINLYGEWKRSIIHDEDFANEIHEHLQQLDKMYISPIDICDYLNQSDVLVRFGRKKPITIRTARKWMKAMEYRYGKAPSGMYVDGHERQDVVSYRNEVFLPQMKEYEKRMIFEDTEPHLFQLRNLMIQNPMLLQPMIQQISQSEPGLAQYLQNHPAIQQPLILVTHDESTFYANDQRKVKWSHKNDTALPRVKGEGVSIMVSDFCTAEAGWLKSKDGSCEARIYFKAGKNREGYFQHEDILRQVDNAIDIFNDRFPGCQALFAFDNATTHSKRADDALSARHMPMKPGWKSQKAPINGMRPGYFGNNFQDLYFPSGEFKGMAQILIERGYDVQGLKSQCKNFKCEANGLDAHCCLRRILYNQPDFRTQKSALEELVESRGHKAIFYPKFHCEINFIEQCWGRGKYFYRMMPRPESEAEMEAKIKICLDKITPDLFKKYANRSARFMDAYRRGLTGKQAIWANRRYHGHRVLPERLMEEMEAHGIS